MKLTWEAAYAGLCLAQGSSREMQPEQSQRRGQNSGNYFWKCNQAEIRSLQKCLQNTQAIDIVILYASCKHSLFSSALSLCPSMVSHSVWLIGVHGHSYIVICTQVCWAEAHKGTWWPVEQRTWWWPCEQKHTCWVHHDDCGCSLTNMPMTDYLTSIKARAQKSYMNSLCISV